MVGAKALGIPASCEGVRYCAKFSHTLLVGDILWNFASTQEMAESYLELSQGETAAGTDTTVVLDGRASHNGSELVDRSGSKGSGLGLAGSASPRLLAGLYHKSQYLKLMMEFFSRRHRLLLVGVSPYLVEVGSNPALPILAEVCMRGQSLESLISSVFIVGGAHGC